MRVYPDGRIVNGHKVFVPQYNHTHIIKVLPETRKQKNLNKEIKTRNVLGRPMCRDEFSIPNGVNTNSLHHCPQHHCAKKASIETTRKQSVIVTSQWLTAGSCIDDVTIVHIFNHLEK